MSTSRILEPICETNLGNSGVAETVLTFNAYIQNAAKLMESKGATVIISSATPDNPCETGVCTATAGRFSTYAHDSAAATGSGYVDHWSYVYQLDVKLGVTATDAFYPNDHTHTSPTGADYYAQAFVKGLSCGTASLKSYINAAGNSVNGEARLLRIDCKLTFLEQLVTALVSL